MVGSLRLRPRSSFQSESCDWTLVRPWAAAEWTASCGFGSARPRTTIKPPKIHLNIRLYSSLPEYVGSFLLEISSASTLEFWLNWKHISENNHSCNRTDTHLSRSLSPALSRALTSSKTRQRYNYNMPWAYLRSRKKLAQMTERMETLEFMHQEHSQPARKNVHSNIHSKPTIATRGLSIDPTPVWISVTCTSAWHAGNAPFHLCESWSSPRVFGAA